MTEDVDINDRADIRRRPHPLLHKTVQRWYWLGQTFRHQWTGEVVGILRTNARHGDGLIIDVLSKDQSIVECTQVISVSEIAAISNERVFLFFETPDEAAAYHAAYHSRALEQDAA